ncbi:MAG: Trk system potassium transporter TrkA, partial [Planctomycetes bacterium]|nr:Trk system potassium transporter TrkA [Planctomycetota bacterium]
KMMNDNLEVFALCGSGVSQEKLESIGIQDMDLAIAVTKHDEVNILCCLMASCYGVPKLVARVKNPEFVERNAILNKDNVGIDLFINSTNIIVEMIDRLIEVPGCTDVAYVGDGSIQVRGFDLEEGSRLVDKTIREVRKELAEDAFSIMAVTVDGHTFLPTGDHVLAIDQRILVLLSTSSLAMFLPLLHRKQVETRKVVLFGASDTSMALAQRLEEKYEQVILLELSKEKCERAAKTLQKTLVLNGNALEKGTLQEILIETVDFFLCLSEDDERNFMAAMMARQYGAKRTVVLTEKPEYLEILDKSDIDIIINPRLITVGKILQFLRRGKLLSAAKLIEGEAEVLEYLVEDDSPITGKKIKALRQKKLLPEGCRVAAIIEEGIMIIPNGETSIKAGQRLVIFALPESLEQVQNLFSGKKWKLV